MALVAQLSRSSAPASVGERGPAFAATQYGGRPAANGDRQADVSTNCAVHFLEHELDLAALADHLHRSPAPPAGTDLALREYRQCLILKDVHHDDRATLLSPSAQKTHE
ncbi:hypothetical protein GGF31_007317 [Allomyces arbusculus]|nr:hypothetical protein GGF31_007317 [Allomyces arbusculus]